MTTKKTLDANDFMMMDVHRPMTDEEIDEVNPQARVDKSLGLPDRDRDRECEEGVGGVPASAGEPAIRLLDPLPQNVELLNVPTSHRLQVQRVLQAALEHGLDDVMVVGWVDDGPVFFLATDPSIGNAVYRLELAKQRLLQAVPDRWQMDVPTTRDAPDEPA